MGIKRYIVVTRKLIDYTQFFSTKKEDERRSKYNRIAFTGLH